ncbi:hypothetical protein DFH09DRAFT_1270834 [Mycena vulgaris]|nr:hypothetical protein DFH09DRAFT_1270834 [Mycena vulgaris]
MSFALENTHISGGNFNNVSGNMTQVFNSQAVHVNVPVDQQLVEGSHGVRGRGINHSTGVIRGSSGHSNFRPYGEVEPDSRYSRLSNVYASDIENGGNRYRPEISENSSGNLSNNIQAGGHNTMHHVGRADIDGSSIPLADFNPGQFQRFAELPHYAGSEPPPPVFPHNTPRTFNSVAGNMRQLNVTSHGESGLDILYRRVVVEALHNSGERFPEPACNPGTRTAVSEQLNTWSIHAATESRDVAKHKVDWGHRSSSNADILSKEHGMAYSRPSRYQLATAIPGLSLPIQQAVEADKLVGGLAMPVQFRRLLLQPFQRMTPLGFLPVIVVDGLDECNNE